MIEEVLVDVHFRWWYVMERDSGVRATVHTLKRDDR